MKSKNSPFKCDFWKDYDVPNKDWYEANKEYYKRRALAYYYANKKDVIKRVVEYNRQNKEKKREWSNRDRARVRRELVALLGGQCFDCKTTIRLEIDHILGGGCADRLARGNNHDMYRYYLKHPEEAKAKLQLLCKKHNLDKEFRNHERYPAKQSAESQNHLS